MTDTKTQAIREVIVAYDALFVFQKEGRQVVAKAEDAQEFLNLVIEKLEQAYG